LSGYTNVSEKLYQIINMVQNMEESSISINIITNLRLSVSLLVRYICKHGPSLVHCYD